jgi:hypothetical protein
MAQGRCEARRPMVAQGRREARTTTCAGAQAKYGSAAIVWAAARLVCSARECGTRGEEGVGANVDARPWDRRSLWGTGVRAWSADGAADAAQRARHRAWARTGTVQFQMALFKREFLQFFQLKWTKV